MAETKSQQSRLLVTLTALFAAFCGLYLLIGGAWLVVLGGSWYYPIAGLVMLGVTVMLFRGKRAALWLYAALLLATMIWGVWEVGFDFWALTPRSDILVFFGIWLILPFVWRRLPVPSAGAVGALVVALLISGGMLTWAGFNDPQEVNGTLSADATPAAPISTVADGDWPAYGRNQEGQRFSPLKQINADNVKNLKEAWVFRTGDLKQPNDPGEITNEVTPIKVGDFANKGILNLQTNMPVTTPGMYEPTSPPIITDKTIVIAGAVTDNFSTREPSGVIRGFDVNTGKLLWAFDPGAKDPNAIPSDEHHFTLNSPNSWAPAAYDAKLDLVYLPMGVTTPDIWGGNRTPEQERYASSIVALNATTGKLAWSYQTVHHDLWDMDMPSQPTLADIEVNGKTVPVIYAPAKTGNIFVLDRRNGELVVPAPEKPVPQGAAKGDYVTKTQPFSDLSFRPKKDLTGADMWGATMFDQLVCRVIFHQLRYEGIFTPPSEQGTKQPAWGYISALDLKTNEVVWKKRIGTPQDSLPFPMPVKLPFTMGMPMLGGPISTAGNVLFIGATADNYLRAYNMSNGEKLWEARLPAGGQATPMTYEVNGKQYVVISAGGHGSFGTKMGDYIVAYALPDDAK